MSASDNASFVDDARAACLCDVGAPDYFVAVCVNAAGDDVLWLVSKTELDAEHPRGGDAAQPHEKLGRLSRGWRDRIWGDQLRCGQPTRNGTPCHHRVANPGDVCGQHRDKVAS